MKRPSALSYISPFVVFLCVLALERAFALGEIAGELILLGTTVPVLWFLARPAITLNVRSWGLSALLGVVVFAVWVGPDLLFPGYRSHWLFQNAVMGAVGTPLPLAARMDPTALTLRVLRTVAIVPLVEELFWRQWLMRWIIDQDFERVPAGAYSLRSFWLVAVLFASEHGPYWDVGLAAGILYNWWMIRVKNLGDLVLAHAVTNACLSGYVMLAGKWQYWL